MKRVFIESEFFTKLTAKVSDSELRRLQQDIMDGQGATISGTGGLQKLRMATSARGKSGSMRVVIAD